MALNKQRKICECMYGGAVLRVKLDSKTKHLKLSPGLESDHDHHIEDHHHHHIVDPHHHYHPPHHHHSLREFCRQHPRNYRCRPNFGVGHGHGEKGSSIAGGHQPIKHLPDGTFKKSYRHARSGRSRTGRFGLRTEKKNCQSFLLIIIFSLSNSKMTLYTF